MRTAAVWIVGTATLSTPVGATSLGNFIFSGLQTRRFAAVWLGCIAAAVLALAIDGAIRLLERGLQERRRGYAWASLAVVAALVLAIGVARARVAPAPGFPVTIGAKSFTEQYVLADLLSGWLARSGDVQATTLPSLGSTVLFDALRSGEIDVYVDYTGTLWSSVMGRSGAPGSRREVLDEVRQSLARDYGIQVAAALGFENTYALAMRAARAEQLKIATLSDLAPVAPQLEIGADYEFLSRPEWHALVAAYGFAFRAARSMDPSLMYQAVAAGEVDVISAFSSDGRIAALDLRVLRDDRGVIPPYDAVVLVGPRLARERPDLVARLARLGDAIDEASMQRMNAAVDQEGRSPAEVAASWLRDHPE